MKTLSALVLLAFLCACSKHQDVTVAAAPLPARQLFLDEFSTMLSREKTYTVTGYVESGKLLPLPPVNVEDTYTFDGEKNDAWITSLEPCIEYHYNYKVFTRNDSILLEWLDFHIVPETFVVSDYKVNEWFELKKGNTFTRYSVLR